MLFNIFPVYHLYYPSLNYFKKKKKEKELKATT